MHDLKQALTGISGILVAPFDAAGELATDRLAPIVKRAIGAGVHVLVANGNTGEFYSLDEGEARRFAEAAAEHVAGRVPLVAGVGRGIREASRAAAHAAGLGADALMVHQPPDPFVSPRGLRDYVARLADAADGVPLVLYLRNDLIGTAAIADICAVPGVIGVKWATPNPLKLKAAMMASADHIVWVGGLAEVWAPPLYAVGARGFTSGLINVWPARSVAIHAALDKGDFCEANSLISGMTVFEDIRAEEMGGANVTGVKAALALMGEDCGATRPPSAWPLTDCQQKRLATFMMDNGLSRKR